MLRDHFCTETIEDAEQVEGRAQPLGLIGVEGLTRPAEAAVAGMRPSITVIRPRPLSLPWGLSPKEIKAASEAGHLMTGLGMNMWYAVLADAHRPEKEVRALVRELKSDIVQAQREAGTPPYWLQIAEGKPAYHANIIFPLGGPKAERLIERIGRSSLFPGDILDIQRAYDVQGVIGYCAAERAPQARYVGGVKMAARLKGSHPLGEGGGDRVTFSKALRSELLAGGRIPPHRRVYASRALSRAMSVASVVLREPDPHGLFGRLPEQPAPPRPWVRTGQRRLKLEDPRQLPLPVERRPDALDLMRDLGSTHDVIAAQIGVSRQQATNILNRQFGASRSVVRRVLALVHQREAA